MVVATARKPRATGKSRAAKADVDLVAAEQDEKPKKPKKTRKPNYRYKSGADAQIVGHRFTSYLDALAQSPRRGRPRSAERVKEMLAKIETSPVPPGATARLKRVQRMMDLRAELEGMESQGAATFQALEAFFVAHAAEFAKLHGISYGAFREMGVPAPTLKEAEISR